MNKKIIFICPYPQNVAPSQRLKYEQYFDHIKAAGYSITVSPFITLPFWKIIYKKGYFFKKTFHTLSAYIKRFGLLFRIRKYDVVYVHLWATPFGPPLYEWLLRKVAKKMIYDIDDLVYLKNVKSKVSSLVTYIKGRKKPIYLMRKADHVITCTPYLDQFTRKYNSQTTDISSTVDTEKRYLPVNDYSNNRILTIGWSGSLNTSKYFYLLEKVLKNLRAKYQFNVLVIGDADLRISELDIEAIDWNEETEIKNLQRIDIGLYPLPDEEWVLGKSGLKAIQYMALGIPTVATAIGANFRVIENNVSGFLVKSDDEWYDAIQRLIENAELRRRIGVTARKRIEELYSIKANAKRYLNVIESLN
jgi:glycosyltransferase involved in cell wall biosynthesis